MGKNINTVITGAAGFIGSHLAKRLEYTGRDLVLLDDFSRGKKEYLDYLGVKTKCIKADLKDYVNNVYFENADVVYHFAAKIGGMQHLHGTAEKELSALQDNLIIDRNVFKACLEHNVKKVIFASSVSVYNTLHQYQFLNVIFKESDLNEMKLDPEGGYGWAKYIGEKQLEMLTECGIKTGVGRIFKCYGPCDSTSDESSNVVISSCKKAIKGKFVLWGVGSVTRDFFYIDDLVEGFLKIEKYLDKNPNITVNFGSGKPTFIRDIAKKIIKISGKKINLEFDEKKQEGPTSRTAIIKGAKDELGWKPKVSLDEGLKKTYDWVKEWKYQ